MRAAAEMTRVGDRDTVLPTPSEFVLQLDRQRHHFRSDRGRVQGPSLLEDLLVVGGVAAAVQHLEVDDGASRQRTFLQQRPKPGSDGRDREPRQRALVRQVDRAQRHAPDITRGLARSKLCMGSSRSACRRRLAATTTASSERFTASFIVDPPRTDVASSSRSSSTSTNLLLMRQMHPGNIFRDIQCLHTAREETAGCWPQSRKTARVAARGEVDVLVVGAGPCSLMAGITMAHYGLEMVVVDQRGSGANFSRALVARTRVMELMRRFGLEEAVRTGAADVDPTAPEPTPTW